MRHAIDTETGPFDPSVKQTNSYALEPYRDEFYVKMVAVVGADGASNLALDDEKSAELIAELDNPVVYMHNAIFDISVLIRQIGYDKIKHIRFRDTGLLAKWINNSQKDEHFRYSLVNCCKKWLGNHPNLPDFVAVKDEMLNDHEYWLERVILDTSMTLDLAMALEKLLPPEQVSGYLTECGCLLPLARGYMQGILVDYDVVEEMRMTYQAKINKLIRELGVQESVIKSPKRLSDLLFNKWELPPEGMTPTGNPSTNSANLKLILLNTSDDRLRQLLEVKSAITVMNKYVNGYLKTKAYLKTDTMHPVPRLFNSYTGRMTYTSKMMKKYQVGIALHQLPRKDKMVKRAMIAPKGYKFFYADFAAQELRLMAQFSQDDAMLEAFNKGLDLHSITTETIYGDPYDEIVKGNRDGDEELTDRRNCGKLTNLSSMYRIGAKSLQTKFFEQYSKLVTLREARHYLKSYSKSYPKIEEYWASAIRSAKQYGYSASLMDRRFHISNMDWKGESSSINQPIQGSGADLAEIVISEVHDRFDDVIFQIQVHDSLTWLIPDEMDERLMDDFIQNIEYSKYVDVQLSLTFPLDSAVGYNLAEMKPL